MNPSLIIKKMGNCRAGSKVIAMLSGGLSNELILPRGGVTLESVCYQWGATLSIFVFSFLIFSIEVNCVGPMNICHGL